MEAVFRVCGEGVLYFQVVVERVMVFLSQSDVGQPIDDFDIVVNELEGNSQQLI